MSESFKMNCTFISEKISKIRWLHDLHQHSSEIFVTGSWDSTKNSIRTWKYYKQQYNNLVDDDDVELIPKCTASIPANGNVHGLEIINSENFVVGLSTGSVSLMRFNSNSLNDNLTEIYEFKNLHKFKTGNPAPCTAVDVFENEIASVGEDGSLNILSIKNGKSVIRSINADNCSITCVSFIGQNEVITGNRMGTLKLFDIRLSNDIPTATFYTSNSIEKVSNAATSCAYHPTQKHILLFGTEEGSVTVWDLRKEDYPASYLMAHESSAITELKFHSSDPTKLFTSAECGELMQYSYDSGADIVDGQFGKYTEIDTMNPWLSGERTKNLIKSTTLIAGIRKSINSFDAVGTKLISCSNNEAVYLIDNLY